MASLTRAWTRSALAALVCYGFPIAVAAQGTGTITGTVIDVGSQRPMPNVQVLLTGTTLGAMTDSRGTFRIVNVTAGTREVRARILGYAPSTKSVVVTAGRITTVAFQLQESALELKAVVTTGTGGSQVEARKLGNTVATIETPQGAPIATFSNILQGRDPSVSMLPNSGIAGEGSSIRIRGNASLSQSNEPIVYVDGVRIDGGGGFGAGYVGTGGGGNPSRLDDLDPSSIEKVEVLKGAAAATLYGTEASNGVLLITTKKGTVGAPKWTVSVEQAAASFPRERMEPQWGFARSDTQATRLSALYGYPIHAFAPFSQGFAERLFQTGMSNTVDAQVTGGTPILNYFGSLRGLNESGPFTAKNVNWQNRGVFMANKDSKYQGTLNLGLSPSETFKVQLNTIFANAHNEIPQNNNSIYAPYTVALFSKPENANCDASMTSKTDPTWGVASPGLCVGSGNPTGASTFGTLRELVQQAIKQDARHYNGNVRASYIPSAALHFDGTVGIDFTSQRSTSFLPFGNNIDLRTNRANNGQASVDDRTNQIVTLSFNGGWNHNLPVNMTSAFSFGAQGFLSRTNDESATNTGFPGPGIEVVGGGSLPQAFESFSQNVNAGFFGQEQLGFHDWMFGTVGGRYDYNSAFGKTSGGVLYPQANISIIPSDRPGWSDGMLGRHLSTFRLRAAIGKAGRQPGAFDKLTTYGPLTSASGGGLVPNNLGNPNLKPEISTEWEVGTELGFNNDRNSIDITRWQRVLNDALYARQFPITGGFQNQQLDNVGQMKAWGWDLKLKSYLVNRPRFSADAYVSTAFLSQIVTNLGGAPPLKVGGSYPRYRNFIKQGWAPGVLFGAALPVACPSGATTMPGGGVCLQPGQLPFDTNKDGKPDTMGDLLAFLATPHPLTAVNPLFRNDDGSGTLNNYLGKPTPDFQGSFGGSMRFGRNWHVGMNFEYKAGHYTITDLTGAFRRSSPSNGGNTQLRAVTEATMLNPASTAQQRADAAVVYAYHLVALSPYDGLNQNSPGDFIRFRELSLQYTAPRQWASLVGSGDMTITLSGQNIWMWTKYPGVDPEVNEYSRSGGGGTDANFGESIDAFGFPLARRFAINVKVGY